MMQPITFSEKDRIAVIAPHPDHVAAAQTFRYPQFQYVECYEQLDVYA